MKNESDDPFPGFSKWENSHCCFKKVISSHRNLIFCGQWECLPTFPIFVIGLAVSMSLLYFHYSYIYYSEIFFILSNVFINIFALLTIISYVRVITIGPGFIPFYWYAYESKNLPKSLDISINNIDDSLAGVISNSSQYTWAYTHPRPPRSILSQKARRFVMRPDHYCYWTAQWIGKRNHKLFMLFNLYGIIFMISFVGLNIGIIRKMIIKMVPYGLILFSLAILGLSVYQIYVLVRTFRNFSRGVTQWEIWNRKDQGISNDGITDVCGENANCLKMLIPYPPFEDISNEGLLSLYSPYINN